MTSPMALTTGGPSLYDLSYYTQNNNQVNNNGWQSGGSIYDFGQGILPGGCYMPSNDMYCGTPTCGVGGGYPVPIDGPNNPGYGPGLPQYPGHGYPPGYGQGMGGNQGFIQSFWNNAASFFTNVMAQTLNQCFGQGQGGPHQPPIAYQQYPQQGYVGGMGGGYGSVFGAGNVNGNVFGGGGYGSVFGPGNVNGNVFGGGGYGSIFGAGNVNGNVFGGGGYGGGMGGGFGSSMFGGPDNGLFNYSNFASSYM